MKTREKKLWAKLREAWRGVPSLFSSRIENKTELGTPDSFLHIFLVQLGYKQVAWAELKTTAAAKGQEDLVRVGIDEDQVKWAERYARRGGTSVVVVQVGRTMVTIPGTRARQLLSPLTTRQIFDLGVVCRTPFDVLEAIFPDWKVERSLE